MKTGMRFSKTYFVLFFIFKDLYLIFIRLIYCRRYKMREPCYTSGSSGCQNDYLLYLFSKTMRLNFVLNFWDLQCFVLFLFAIVRIWSRESAFEKKNQPPEAKRTTGTQIISYEGNTAKAKNGLTLSHSPSASSLGVPDPIQLLKSICQQNYYCLSWDQHYVLYPQGQQSCLHSKERWKAEAHQTSETQATLAGGGSSPATVNSKGKNKSSKTAEYPTRKDMFS